MPYKKYFIADASASNPEEAMLFPVDDDFPDIGAFTQYHEIPAAMVLAYGDDTERLLQKHAADIKAHFGRVGFLRDNGKLVWGKIVPARVPELAILEWMVDARDRNLAAKDRSGFHYPDRPPDIDTNAIRAWTLHPSRPEDLGASTTDYDDDEDEEHPKSPDVIYSIGISQPAGMAAKISVVWHLAWEIECSRGWPETGQEPNPDGLYQVRFKLEREDGEVRIDQSRFYTLEETDRCWEDAEKILEFASKVGTPRRHPATYFDFLEIDREFKLCREEAKAYYEQEAKLRPVGEAMPA